MTDPNLTQGEKTVLLAHMDGRSRLDYDPKFLKLLASQNIPSMDQLPDRIRRAILRFMTEYWRGMKLLDGDGKAPSEEWILATMTCCYFIGYEMGRKLRSPLSLKSSKPE